MTVYVDITTERNRKLTFGTVYRPPKLQAADDTALYEEINSITQNMYAIIVGDFNCPNVDWNLMHGAQEGSRLVEMVEDSFLKQIVNQPTREHNILDLVLVTDPDLIHDCAVGEKLNGCDHHLIVSMSRPGITLLITYLRYQTIRRQILIAHERC